MNGHPSFKYLLSITLALVLSTGLALSTGCESSSGSGNSSASSGSSGSSDTDTDTGTSDGTTSSDGSAIGDRTDYSSLTLTSGGIYSSGAIQTVQYMQYTSTTSDTPAVKASGGGSLTITNSKATKSGSTGSEDNSNFYGVNAGVLASSSGSTTAYSSGSASSISMTDCTIKTTSTGSNGAFAFGADASLTLNHVTIVTTADSSRGVDATYGGTVTVRNSKIRTSGAHCAALATDRYTGTTAPTITVSNCSGGTTGDGSPGIYCTGTFTVTDSTLTATGSEAAVIEGLNSITLTDSSISGASKWGVMIYQSNSGDSSVGQGTFTMSGGTLTNNYSSGPAFFVCNTTAVINLTGVTVVNSSGTLLKAMAPTGSDNTNTSWGSLGGTVTFNSTDQDLEGNIVLADSLSSITMTLSSSTFSGAINNGNKGKSASLSLDSSSEWTATADSYLTTISGVVFSSGTPANVDANTGITIYYTNLNDSDGSALTGTYILQGGGCLKKAS